MHVTGAALFKKNSDIYGVLMTEGTLEIKNTLNIYDDPVTDANPPKDYFSAFPKVVPISCSRVVN